jgi:hypothetical protein
MGVLNRLDSRGHGLVAKWDPKVEADIVKAKTVFDDHQGEGYTMFDISEPAQSRRLESFDPAAKEILAVPRMVAG